LRRPESSRRARHRDRMQHVHRAGSDLTGRTRCERSRKAASSWSCH
jgi:hypothetical protein